MSKTNKKEYENKMRNDLKPMRNASFLGVNDGNTMRNGKRLRDSILSAFFHSYIFAMYKNEALWI